MCNKIDDSKQEVSSIEDTGDDLHTQNPALSINTKPLPTELQHFELSDKIHIHDMSDPKNSME